MALGGSVISTQCRGKDQKGSGRGLILRIDPGISLEEIRNTTNIFNRIVSSHIFFLFGL
jgi:hypothetical protein